MERTRNGAENPPRASELADWALSRGRSSMTTEEIAHLLGVSRDQVRKRLHAPAKRGHWTNPAAGLWIAVPPEYRLWGAPEGIEIVDPLMKHLGIQYYVGWLSAAAIHGASHHAPQQFQVAVEQTVRDRKVGRTYFRFASRSRVALIPVIEKQTRSGTARVASIEATALDLCDAPRIAGGIDAAATVLIELAEQPGLSIQKVLDLSPHFPAAAARRLGWLLTRFTDRDDLDDLRAWAADASHAPSKLDASEPSQGPIDKDWSLIINTNIEPEA